MFTHLLPVCQKLTLELKIQISYPSSEAISVSLGSYYKIPENGLLIKSRNLFLALLEARKSKIKALADSVSRKNLLSGL